MKTFHLQLIKHCLVFSFLLLLSIPSLAQTQNDPTPKDNKDVIKPRDIDPGNGDTNVYNADTNALGIQVIEVTELYVYPNPSTNGIVQVNSDFSIPLTLFSIDGKEILRFFSNSKLSLTEVPKGVYIIRSIDAQYLVKPSKLILK